MVRLSRKSLRDRAQAGFRPLRNSDPTFPNVASRRSSNRFCGDPNDPGRFSVATDLESGSLYAMKLLSAVIALLASLLIVGCATKGDQLTPAETSLEKKDQRGWSAEEGRVP